MVIFEYFENLICLRVLDMEIFTVFTVLTKAHIEFICACINFEMSMLRLIGKSEFPSQFHLEQILNNLSLFSFG